MSFGDDDGATDSICRAPVCATRLFHAFWNAPDIGIGADGSLDAWPFPRYRGIRVGGTLLGASV